MASKNDPNLKTKETKNSEDEKKNNKNNKKEEEEISEEDLKYKQMIELFVQRIEEQDPAQQKSALVGLQTEIKSSTSSMTSVPKPLKYLRIHYHPLKHHYETVLDSENRILLADILSLLATTNAPVGSRECLKFKLEGNIDDTFQWGHEYVRHLTAEIGEEFAVRQNENKEFQDLLNLVSHIVPFFMKHNGEPDACDLLMEVEQLQQINQFIDDKNFSRTCLYLLSCANYVPEPEDTEIFKTVLSIYRQMRQLPDALRVAIRLNDLEIIEQIYTSCEDLTLKKQLAFMLARQSIFSTSETDDNYLNIINNTKLSEYFHALATDLEVSEPKKPDDVFKSMNTENTIPAARNKLAQIFANAFANVGSGKDKLLLEKDSHNLNNTEFGLTTTIASIGLLFLWDIDNGLQKIDPFLYSTNEYAQAGALLAAGIISANIRNECDPALGLINDFLVNKHPLNVRACALLGLGIAYAGTAREDILSSIEPFLESSVDPKLTCFASLAVGQIFAGTGHSKATGLLVQVLLESEDILSNNFSRFLCLGLGLIYLGRQEESEVTIEMLKTITVPMANYAMLTVETCAYATTGNVLKVQKLLQICGEHLEKDNQFQGVAVIGIALIAMGEDVGSEMSMRAFEHLLQYGEAEVRRAVPLAYGLISISNPRVTVMDRLSKLTHDSDMSVARNATFALGLIGAGTNNARIAGLLRQLMSYHKDQDLLFIVRLAQGLLHMGKGTVTLSPFYSHNLLYSRTGLAGLLVTLHCCLDLQNTVLSKSHFLLFSLTNAIFPRMLMTFDESMQPLQIPVRVGQAVDTVGQAGKPKTITGFQTHNTPVLLATTDRAELATDEYIALTNVLEGFVILKKNPNAVPKKL
eukprot:TRINITY_DN1378_c0_g1_i1.p1 TRINITY_DN1378_c0_g1~~TRINITY_DN1378_c0_g1_i1.p1  ORF type:complete len:865 (-),score=424.26 TRINITY_DN1378_c0_g1_i1:147-2741(-)